MRGDIPQAAFRLSCALPVRTHERTPFVRPQPQGSKFGREITIDGVRYDSIHDAKKKLRVCSGTVYDWLATGRAKR